MPARKHQYLTYMFYIIMLCVDLAVCALLGEDFILKVYTENTLTGT